MIAIVQRVIDAQVVVDNQTKGAIDSGALVYLGVEQGDTETDLDYMAKKISNLRIFPDQKGVMNRSVLACGGSILLISQFTLCAETKKGNRPYYGNAAAPEDAKRLYLQLGRAFEERGITTAYGVFGAHMHVTYTNDGPVTIPLNSRTLK